jgi:hypothetical protein
MTSTHTTTLERLGLEKQMSKVIRASISFDYYPDEDNIMTDLSPEEQIEYVRESMIEDIYSFVKYNEVAEAIKVEVVNG